MDALALPLLIYYAVVILIISAYGLHRYWMVWAFARARRRDGPGRPAARLDPPPRVTVQLPMFNERNVAERVIRAACAIEYPPDRLQVQVLDDSTDDSADVARRCCEELLAAGHDVEYRHRRRRTGFKAGALADGLATATGEFIAVFDADFVPPADILRQTIDHFADDEVGMVQTRWSHLNREESWLTDIQAMYLDGHFVVEQRVRCDTRRWFNFNGTAGVWRRRCIDEAGGWQQDTLTEDTDLSYRAQIRGWRFRYLPDVQCPAEVPPTMTALLSQQHRWNKGLMQTAIKLLPTILSGPYPWRRKVEAWFHLTCPIVHAAILMLVLLVAPALAVALPVYDVDPVVGTLLGLGILLMGTVAAGTFYVSSQSAQNIRLWRTLVRLPVLMAIGIGISVTNTRAVLEALFGGPSPFVRTPKYAGATESDLDPAVAKRQRLLPPGSIEIALGLVMIACLVLTILRPHALVGAPFVALFAAGFFAVGVPSFGEWLRRSTRGRSLASARAASA
ncbi:MAG: glycosyltransferase [Planctomycetota bacterium]|jgi:cellulose synthase/poly-beta-1,6-N-acetylglucosamine synthase-like glycosyltransferase